MDGAVTMKVEGLADLDRALADLPKATAKATARRALMKAGRVTANRAESLAPDDPATGSPDLHRSIEVSPKHKSGRQIKRTKEGPTTVLVYVGPTKSGYPQAIPQEFGSVKMPPHPFMRPAWEQTKGQVLEVIKTELKVEIAKTVARIARKRLKAAKG